MHLIIGAGEFLGDQVSRTLASEVPLIESAGEAGLPREAPSAARHAWWRLDGAHRVTAGVNPAWARRLAAFKGLG